MIVKSLNGDLYAVEHVEELAQLLDVPATRIVLTPFEHDSEQSDFEKSYCCVVKPLSVTIPESILTKFINHKFWRSVSNDKLLSFGWENRDKCEWIWANPSPIIVEKIFHHISHSSPTYRMSGNPNDRVIDFLLDHPHMIRIDVLCTNPNPRVIDHIISVYTQSSATEMMRLKEIFEWTKFKECLHEKWFDFLWNIGLYKLQDLSFLSKHADHIPLLRQLLVEHFDKMIDSYHFSECPDEEILRRYVENHSKKCREGAERLKNIPNASYQSEFTYNYPFCQNTNNFVVETLLSIDNIQYENWAFAMNTDDRAVHYWEARMPELENDLRFWNCFMRNPHPRSVQHTVDWLRRDVNKRLTWFMKEYDRTTRNSNPRLAALLLEMVGENITITNQENLFKWFLTDTVDTVDTIDIHIS